jgi:hypothetical protein
MVPGLKLAFDRVECALEAATSGLPPAREIEPPPPVTRALPPAAVPALAGGPVAMAGAQTVRPQVLAGTNLALLAAGTAVTIYLWFRVFGPDAGQLPFSFGSASPAFEQSSVAAVVDLTPAPEARPLPESDVRGAGSQFAATATAPVLVAGQTGGTLVSDRKPAKKKQQARRNRGPVARPSAPSPPPAPPAEPTPTRSAPVPTFPVPSSPPPNRVPGPTIPGGGGGSHPGAPTPPGGGSRG